jgi:cell division GTPase FtsZ
VDAAKMAIASPLLEYPVNKAKGIVFNIQGGQDMTLQEVGQGVCTGLPACLSGRQAL